MPNADLENNEQLELFEIPIPSPCIRRCETDSKGYCLGCYRSREERFQWLKMTTSQQKDVIRLCKQRKYRRWLALQKQQEQDANQSSTLPLFDDD